VRESLQGYFRDLGGETPDGMYDMLVRVVEKPLLEVVMSTPTTTSRAPPNGWA
jgi:Fis family transcriptional regulator